MKNPFPVVAFALILVTTIGGQAAGSSPAAFETEPEAEIEQATLFVQTQGTVLQCGEVPLVVQRLAGREDTRSVENCSSAQLVKAPMNAYVTFRIEGVHPEAQGVENDLQCWWPPNESMRCHGTWRHSESTATATLSVWEPITGASSAVFY